VSEEELREYWRDVQVAPHPRVYKGYRDKNGKCFVRVAVGERWSALKLYLGVMRHSPTGFEWSYSGSGPAQLALALLMDALGGNGKEQRERAIRHHQSFKSAVVAKLPQASWSLTQQQVLDVLARLESKERGS
jgi:hypothetical protein